VPAMIVIRDIRTAEGKITQLRKWRKHQGFNSADVIKLCRECDGTVTLDCLLCWGKQREGEGRQC